MNKIAKAFLCLSLCLGISGCLETAVTNPNKPAETPGGTIRELTLEKSAVVIEKGATASVKVTDGNGGYTATVTAGGDFASVSILGNTITITAVAEGEATVTVGDNEEETKTIKVTVIPAQEVVEPDALFEQNLTRAMGLVDIVMEKHSRNATFDMRQSYNPVNQGFAGTASVWDYTGIIEAVNSILLSLEDYKLVNPEFYNRHFTKYSDLLDKLYENILYYRGTFTLVSFTQTKEWRVYAVPRAAGKDKANVVGDRNRNNVYDDQMWLIKEMLETYKLTGEDKYLEEAEYLTSYVLDGWDCTLDGNGNEYGGIPWGPGYVTMHSCSNGPIIAPLVWLHDIYKGKPDEIEHRYIGGEDNATRMTEMKKKDEYYLEFAKKVYDYQRRRLRRSDYLYADMIGWASGNGYPETEYIDGIEYRAHTPLSSGSGGDPHSYNTGTMLSGAAELYRVTGDQTYLEDAKKSTSESYTYFSTSIPDKPGCRKFRDTSDFVRWFDNVLMRGYVDLYPFYNNTSVCIETYQNNLDYAYENSLKEGFLPKNLTEGWDSDASNNRIQILASCAYATEYAILARYELQKEN